MKWSVCLGLLLLASACATTPQGVPVASSDVPSFGYLHYLCSIEGQPGFMLNITSEEGELTGSYSWIDNTAVNSVDGTIDANGTFSLAEYMEDMAVCRIDGVQNPVYTELEGALIDETTSAETPFRARLIAEEVRADRTLEHIGPEAVQMDIAYPEFETAGGVVFEHLNQLLAEKALKAADVFEEEITGLAAESAESEEPFPVRGYFSFSDYQIVSCLPGYVCIRFDAYQFTGGAHGMPLCETVNVALDPDGSLRLLELDDVLGSPEAFDQIASRTLDTLREMEAGFVTDGSVTSLERGQLSSFTLSPAGLVFIIAPYEAGSYAEGQFEVEFALDQIVDLMNPDILARLR